MKSRMNQPTTLDATPAVTAAILHTSPTLPPPMNRQDIADYLGLTIEAARLPSSPMPKQSSSYPMACDY